MNSLKIIKFETLPSTNTYAKENIGSLPLPCIIIADGQTAGRGRRGNSFYSPSDTGLYMTAVFEAPSDCSLLTPAAAVSVCEALEKFALSPKIKWVNDVFIDGKKICGILTEIFTHEGNKYIALGIGINLTTKRSPEDLTNAGAVCMDINKEMLAADISSSILDYCNNPINSEVIKDYEKRLFIIGQNIAYQKNNIEYSAEVIGINKSCNLIVKKDNGDTDILSSGEISIKL